MSTDLTSDVNQQGPTDGHVHELLALFEQTTARLAGLEEDVRRLQAENSSLRSAAVSRKLPADKAGASPAGASRVATPALSRRGVLLGGAGAVAAGAVALAASASPAAANAGDAVVMGQLNDAGTTETTIESANSNGTLELNNTGSGAALWLSDVSVGTGEGLQSNLTNDSNPSPSIVGYTSGTGNGVTGSSANTGSTNAGVNGVSISATGFGVRGTNSTAGGTGVYGSSGIGVHGMSQTPSAIPASAFGGHAGVWGDRSAGYGVVGTSDTNAAVLGFSSGGIALYALENGATPGTGLLATSSLGTAATIVSDATQLVIGPASSGRIAPTGDSIAHVKGELLADGNGDLWYCYSAGTPGLWRKVVGPATAGAFHVLPTPVRIYDSRPGTFPGVGPKTPLVANTARTLDLTVNSSNVPAGATAAMVSLLVVNAATGNANFTIWANGATRPLANSMVWGGTAGRFSSLGLTALDATAKVQVLCSVQTDIVVDVIGYYR